MTTITDRPAEKGGKPAQLNWAPEANDGLAARLTQRYVVGAVAVLIVAASVVGVVYQASRPSRDLYADYLAGYRVGATVGYPTDGLRMGPCDKGMKARYPKSIRSEAGRDDTAVFLRGCVDGIYGHAPSRSRIDEILHYED